jgi:nucleoid-associated protein YgaU
MSESISNPYNTLLAGWNTQQAALPSPAATAPAANTIPSAPVDQVTLSTSPSAAVMTPAVMPPALTPADVRAELAALQNDLAKLNQKIEALMARVDAVPSNPPAGQAPVVSTGEPSVAPSPAAAPNHPVSHDVKAGDYLWKIAHEQLGDASRWPEIYALNRDVIGENPNLLQPGQKLRLPAPAAAPTAPPPLPGVPTPAQRW